MDNIAHHAEVSCEKILVGNKIDVPSRCIDSARGAALAESYSIPYIETSAKTGTGTEEAFHTLIRAIIRKLGTSLDELSDAHGSKNASSASSATHTVQSKKNDEKCVVM